MRRRCPGTIPDFFFAEQPRGRQEEDASRPPPILATSQRPQEIEQGLLVLF
jgi:hypothetical protein